MGTRSGSIHLFRFAGIDLFLHWSWFVVAIYEIQGRSRYSTLTWNIVEYLTLFVIVMLHEFGHALACRQVGGVANRIVLWPLGGVAYVDPPPRPGATLWSIAAGPLVNVVILGAMLAASTAAGINAGTAPSHLSDPARLFQAVWYMNFGLLVFNLLPVYPLDGGQILQALLWFVIGRARGLMVATLLGFLGVAAFLLLAWSRGSFWLGIVALFLLANCWQGFLQARQLIRAGRGPRRPGAMCPSCQKAPPIGLWWTCSACGKPFDFFESNAVCPNCGARFSGARCLNCGETHSMSGWHVSTPPISGAR